MWPHPAGGNVNLCSGELDKRNALSNPYVEGFSRQILHTSSAADESNKLSGCCDVDDSGTMCRNQHSSPLRQYPVKRRQVACKTVDWVPLTLGIESARLGLIKRSKLLLLSVKKLAVVSSETTAGSHEVATSASRFGSCGSVHVDICDFSVLYLSL
jgi:hypothetical protein